MLKVPIIEAVLRGVPEACLLTWAIYLINFKKITIKPYIISVFTYAIGVYLIRMLPIQYGIHTIFGLIILIIVVYFVIKITLEKAIAASLIDFILLSICEWLNVFLLKFLFKIDIEKLDDSSLMIILSGVPSLLLFIFFIYMFYLLIKKRKEQSENVSN